VSEQNLQLLEGMDFVFISMEAGTVKKPLIENLLRLEIPFIEVGMGSICATASLAG
jgi:hypothetical protein